MIANSNASRSGASRNTGQFTPDQPPDPRGCDPQAEPPWWRYPDTIRDWLALYRAMQL
jgi:hypothetical protein